MCLSKAENRYVSDFEWWRHVATIAFIEEIYIFFITPPKLKSTFLSTYLPNNKS